MIRESHRISVLNILRTLAWLNKSPALRLVFRGYIDTCEVMQLVLEVTYFHGVFSTHTLWRRASDGQQRLQWASILDFKALNIHIRSNYLIRNLQSTGPVTFNLHIHLPSVLPPTDVTLSTGKYGIGPGISLLVLFCWVVTCTYNASILVVYQSGSNPDVVGVVKSSQGVPGPILLRRVGPVTQVQGSNCCCGARYRVENCHSWRRLSIPFLLH